MDDCFSDIMDGTGGSARSDGSGSVEIAGGGSEEEKITPTNKYLPG